MTGSGTDTGAPDLDAPNPAAPEPHESADGVVSDTSDGTSKSASSDTGNSRLRMSFSVSGRGLAVGLLIVVLTATAATFAWLYLVARREIDAQTRESEGSARAEKVALEYAVNAAAMNYQDLNAWKVRLVRGTTPDLNKKLTEAAQSMEQILVPLEWMSTAKPLTAKVRSHNGGAYVVDCFVSVQTKTVQAPDALQSTATYSVAIDSTKDWQITDVGGIGSVVGQS